ncbi:MGMT family protein [Parvibaculaceae bacterium PLY_AMNH_Bact1]|nr:MGMT family protein [Parvibaculaceae bacterium PLY_AMNH_Bact1]
MDYTRLYELIAEIPAGQVATYGQLAKIVGCGPRQVGHALGALDVKKAKKVPWHRVVNSQGKISVRAEGGGETLQGDLLRKEGIIWRASGRIDLKTYGWAGPFDPDAWR